MEHLASRKVTLGIILIGFVLAYVGLEWSGLLEPIPAEYGPYDKGPIPAMMIAIGAVMAIVGISRGIVVRHEP